VNELFGAFLLGNAAILTNVCLLPLYPGLIAFLAGNAANERAKRVTPWLGLMVLLGILSLMTVVGLLLYQLQASFGGLLVWLLPVIYGAVIVLGALMLFGVNPFARFGGVNTPALSNPLASAYLYGVLLGPMTLPCTGPVVVSAFLLGAGSAAALTSSLLYFFAFGLGFGWPLVLLPFAALPLQRRGVGWLTKRHTLLTRISGVLLLGIGVFGVVTELLPQLT
jgi:cytochrome c-type biogenesis protein